MNPPINKRTTLAVTTAASFLTLFAATSINIALPSIGRDFAMNAILLREVCFSRFRRLLLWRYIRLVGSGQVALTGLKGSVLSRHDSIKNWLG